MGAVKKISAGAVLAGGGYALEMIGSIIFSTTGAVEGPYVNYRTLISLSSTALIGIGILLASYGLLEGTYRLWERRQGEEETRSSRSRTS